jgi:hypothetical protein
VWDFLGENRREISDFATAKSYLKYFQEFGCVANIVRTDYSRFLPENLNLCHWKNIIKLP